MSVARPAAPRRKHLEQREPLHRLDGRRPVGEGSRRGARSRTPLARRRIRVRRRVHVGAEARDPDAVDCARRAGLDVDSGREELAPQRAPLRRAAGLEQGRDRRRSTARRRSRSGAAATTFRRRRSMPGDERHPAHDPRYAALDASELPLTESLKETVERFLPYWHDAIAPAIKSGKRVLITAHGNSLRALVKYLDSMSNEEIVELNIPTGMPLVYELDDTSSRPDTITWAILKRSRRLRLGSLRRRQRNSKVKT